MSEQYCRCARGLLRLSFLGLFCCLTYGATAVVECVADAAIGTANSGNAPQLPLTGVVMRFRFEAIRNWKVSKAQLHVHMAVGKPPSDLDVAFADLAWQENQTVKVDLKKVRFLRHKAEGQPEGWIRLELEPSLVEMLASGKATTVVIRDRTSAAKSRLMNARESNFAAAYLLVEGEKPR